MGLKLNTASSGSVTLEPANTASNYTLTVPAQTGTVVATDSSGNVGIGTSSPTVKLDVRSGNVNIPNGWVSSTGWQSNGTEFTTASSIYNGIYGLTGNNIAFATVATERMRIDSSGNLLAGGRTSSSGTSQAGVQILNGGLNRAEWFTDAGNYSIIFYAKGGGLNGGIVTNSGTVTYATTSDYRLKDNVAPMTGALAQVSALKPVTYKWKADGSEGQGFIAHELQAVVPDAVVGEKDAVDADGNPVYQGIDTSFLVATLTAAIQELKAELDTVKTELATLKGQA